MEYASLALGIVGALTGFVALYFSHRATEAASSSATSDEKAIANALTPDIVIEISREVAERWKFTCQEKIVTPSGNLPELAIQEETFDASVFKSLIVACGVRIVIRNFGNRPAKVTIGNAVALATQDDLPDKDLEDSGHFKLLNSMPENTFDILPGPPKFVIIYAGNSVQSWITDGRPSSPKEFSIPIDVNCGPDAARLHWLLKLSANIYDSPQGQLGKVGIGPANPPSADLEELKRTIN